jgi:hypothetical protein
MTGAGLKVAVLDNGFANLDKASGLSLPPGLKVEPYPKNEPSPDDHGTRMTEIMYALATGESRYTAEIKGPELLLFNTNGFSNFKHAVSQVIARRVDVVLYAQVWQYGGNFDGEGFINAEVDKAVEAGILWINAAGNFAENSFETTLKETTNDEVKLPDFANSLQFSVSQADSNLKIVASWSDYRNTEFAQTNIDLDLQVINNNGKVVSSSNLRQLRSENGAANSKYPREVIIGRFDRGLYGLKLKNNSNQPLDPEMKVRLTIQGEGVKITRTQRNNSLMIPADNQGVVTVGASDYSGSSGLVTDELLSKPEVLSSSLVQFSDGFDVRSTSTAAAIFAGAVLPYLQQNSYLDKDSFLDGIAESKDIVFMQPGLEMQKNQRRAQGGELPPPGPGQNGTQQNQNSFANGNELSYPLDEGGANDQQQPKDWNSPQDAPRGGQRWPRPLQPQPGQPESPAPQQPDRQNDIPPFRAVN